MKIINSVWGVLSLMFLLNRAEIHKDVTLSVLTRDKDGS